MTPLELANNKVGLSNTFKSLTYLRVVNVSTCQSVVFHVSTYDLLDWKQNVALIAVVSSTNINKKDGHLPFDRVISNFGDGYNEKTGVFRAPMAGIYVLNVSVNIDKIQGLLKIIVNSKSIMDLFDKDSRDHQPTGTIMVMSTLKEGDHVWVHQNGKIPFKSNAVPLITLTVFML